MSPVPASAITITGGEITIDADGTLRDRLSIMLVESLAPAAKAPPANTGHRSWRDLVRTAS